jgi:hypothetical protein
MVTSLHGVLETVLLSGVRDMEAGVLPVVIIQKCEDDEYIPDMIWCEDTSKLPPAGGKITFLLLR